MGRRAGIFEEWALEGIFEEQLLEDREPPQGWAREPETEGWTEPAVTTERGDGPVQSPDQSLSLSDPPPCPIVPAVYSAHPQPRCRGRSSSLRSHCLLHSSTWQALLPALAP